MRLTPRLGPIEENSRKDIPQPANPLSHLKHPTMLPIHKISLRRVAAFLCHRQ
jgi:hypothetical protein